MALLECKECGRMISSKAEKCPNCGAKNTSLDKIVVNMVITAFVVFIAIFFIDRCSSSTSTDTNTKTQKSMENILLENPTHISPYGELADIFNLGSDYTDVQRENKAAELKGKIVQWSLPVYEISRNKSGYRVQTRGGRAVGTFIYITPADDEEKSIIEGLKTGDTINFKGRIKGISLRNVEITPAILMMQAKQPANETQAPAPSPGSVLIAATGGNSDAQFTVGFWYHKGGNGYQQNESKRNYWYCKSAIQGNEEAIANIEMYLNNWKTECSGIVNSTE
ncbi:MAG: hypothetical protein ACOYOS_16110 [Syntrophales bacterium]